MYDELGNKIVTSYAFTGSSAAGTLDAYPNCLDWSSHDGGTNGAAGNTDRTGAFWTLGLYNACNSLNGIYCFQVDQGRALPPFASDGKKVFVTSVTGTGDLGGWPQSDGETGLLAGDAICNSLADDASLTGTFVSWISDDTTDAKDRITSDGPWVRLDGMLVAEDKAGLVSGELNAPVNQDEYGSYLGVQGVSPDVWTGTNEFGVVFAVGVTCSDWADGSDGVSSFYGKLVSSSGSWTKDSSVTCDGSRRLYCFEN
jgi:hypothetical protein